MGRPRISNADFERSLAAATVGYGMSSQIHYYRQWHETDPTLTLYDMLKLEEMENQRLAEEDWAAQKAEWDESNGDDDEMSGVAATGAAWGAAAVAEEPLRVLLEGGRLVLPGQFERVGATTRFRYEGARTRDASGERLGNSYGALEVGLPEETIRRLFELYEVYKGPGPYGADHLEYEELEEEIKEAITQQEEV